MTPGPVQVPENVRLARSLSTTNADLDPQFYDEYKETCELISDCFIRRMNTDPKRRRNPWFRGSMCIYDRAGR